MKNSTKKKPPRFQKSISDSKATYTVILQSKANKLKKEKPKKLEISSGPVVKKSSEKKAAKIILASSQKSKPEAMVSVLHPVKVSSSTEVQILKELGSRQPFSDHSYTSVFGPKFNLTEEEKQYLNIQRVNILESMSSIFFLEFLKHLLSNYERKYSHVYCVFLSDYHAEV